MPMTGLDDASQIQSFQTGISVQRLLNEAFDGGRVQARGREGKTSRKEGPGSAVRRRADPGGSRGSLERGGTISLKPPSLGTRVP